MEGIIFDIKRFAIHDGPGIRTTVFFKGCPLDCWWCHNPESKSMAVESYQAKERIGSKELVCEKTVGYKISVDDLIVQLQKEQLFMEEGGGGITLSGGEPLMQAAFATEVLKMCKALGWHTTIDTAGFVARKSFEQVLPYTDLFLFDIKLASDSLHQKYIGVKNQLIIDNFKFLIKENKKVMVRIPVIPGVNMNAIEMSSILNLLEPLKGPNFQEIHFLPYHKIGQSKYERFGQTNRMGDTKEPDLSDVTAFSSLFEQAGFTINTH